MHRLSIVIPCPVFNEHVEDTLVSVLQNRPSQCEVILVTAGQYDDPYDLASEVHFVQEAEDASLVRLVNLGFEAARSEVVHLLQPGMRVVEGWTEPVLEHFDEPPVGAVSPAIVHDQRDTRAFCLGIGYWSCGVRRVLGRGAKLAQEETRGIRILGPSFLAGFYRREVLAALGRFDERMGTSCADVELALAVRQLGYQAVVEPACRVIGGAWAIMPDSSFQRARQMERLYRRYAAPGVVTRILHALTTTADVLRGFPRPQMMASVCGRLAAWIESGIQQQQHERVRQAQAHLARSAPSSAPMAIRVDFSAGRAKRQSGVAGRLRRAA